MTTSSYHAAMDDATGQADQALVIKPGDILVLRYARALSSEEMDVITEMARTQVPESIRIMIIDQCAQMAVIRP
jgi:hypothetical protein